MVRVRPLFENSTVCLKIDAKYPVLMGHGLAGLSGLGGLCFGRFSFGCEIVAPLFLTGDVVGSQCFTAGDQYGLSDALFRASGGFLLRWSSIQRPFGGC